MVPEIVGGVLLSYVLCSFVLLFFPGILHKRKQPQFICQHISHRGGCGERPENTMVAFEHAVESCGTQMLELDVQLTRDHRVVVAHDAHLRRAGLPQVKVNDLTYDQLPELSHELPIDFQPGHVYNAVSFAPAERRIPLLSEVFQRFPDVPINVDVKVDDDRLIEETVRLVGQFSRQHLTCWGNARAAIVDKLHAKDPSVPLLFPMRAILLVVFSAFIGLLPFLPLRWSYYEVPMPSVLLPYATTRLARLAMWLADKMLMRPFIFNHLHRRGIQVYVWVLNEESEFRRAFELGADGVMTDYPTRLRAFLQQNRQYTSRTPVEKPTSAPAAAAAGAGVVAPSHAGKAASSGASPAQRTKSLSVCTSPLLRGAAGADHGQVGGGGGTESLSL